MNFNYIESLVTKAKKSNEMWFLLLKRNTYKKSYFM